MGQDNDNKELYDIFSAGDDSDANTDDGSESLYSVSLKDFDGPFDTLCHLIRQSKYSIEDVKISDITEQYMVYMRQIDDLDLEKATEFVTMAAWLIEIKSKSMLPKPVFDDVDTEDPEKILKQQIAQYALFKEVSQKMREVETVGMYFKEPDKSSEPRFEIKSMDISGLMGALERVFLKLGQRVEQIKERHIVKDRFTVEEKIAHIKEIIENEECCTFFSLFDIDITKSEIITTFQALLELLKLQYITANQSEIYGDIVLKRAIKANAQNMQDAQDTEIENEENGEENNEY